MQNVRFATPHRQVCAIAVMGRTAISQVRVPVCQAITTFFRQVTPPHMTASPALSANVQSVLHKILVTAHNALETTAIQQTAAVLKAILIFLSKLS